MHTPAHVKADAAGGPRGPLHLTPPGPWLPAPPPVSHEAPGAPQDVSMAHSSKPASASVMDAADVGLDEVSDMLHV